MYLLLSSEIRNFILKKKKTLGWLLPSGPPFEVPAYVSIQGLLEEYTGWKSQEVILNCFPVLTFQMANIFSLWYLLITEVIGGFPIIVTET